MLESSPLIIMIFIIGCIVIFQRDKTTKQRQQKKYDWYQTWTMALEECDIKQEETTINFDESKIKLQPFYNEIAYHYVKTAKGKGIPLTDVAIIEEYIPVNDLNEIELLHLNQIIIHIQSILRRKLH